MNHARATSMTQKGLYSLFLHALSQLLVKKSTFVGRKHIYRGFSSIFFRLYG